jgi:hypothetical protein
MGSCGKDGHLKKAYHRTNIRRAEVGLFPTAEVGTMRKEQARSGSASLFPVSSHWLHAVSVHSRSSDAMSAHKRAPSARTGPSAVCATGHEEENAVMARRQARLRVRRMCGACVLALIVSGTGSATAGPRVAMPDLEKQAAAFLQRLGFALHGEVVCASVSIGTPAYVCQALGVPQNPDAGLQQAQAPRVLLLA